MNTLTANLGHHASWHPGQTEFPYEILGEMEHEEVPWEPTLITDRLDSVVDMLSLLQLRSQTLTGPLLRMLHIQIPETSHRWAQPKTKKIGTPISPVAAFSNEVF